MVEGVRTLAGKTYDITLITGDGIGPEIAVNDNFAGPTVETIIKGARTGKIGDGKIFVQDLPECIRIRTGQTGGEAIG